MTRAMDKSRTLKRVRGAFVVTKIRATVKFETWPLIIVDIDWENDADADAEFS